VLGRIAREHGRPRDTVRPASRGRGRSLAAVWVGSAQSGYPRRPGASRGDALRERDEHDEQRRADRSRLRGARQEAARARGQDRTRGVTSFATHLECSRCQEDFPVDQIQQVCKSDGGPLLVRYDLRRVRDSITKDALRERPETLWRYRELLPMASEDHVSLGEAM